MKDRTVGAYDVGDVVGAHLSSQLSYVLAGVVTRRPVRPERFPEVWREQRGLGKTHLLDEPDVERPLELGIAEDPDGQHTDRGSRKRDEVAECPGIGGHHSVSGVRAPIVADE